jgi:hypothetical protein
MKVKFAIIIFLMVGVSLSCQINEDNYLSVQEIKVYKKLLNGKPKMMVVIDESRVGIFGEISTGGLKEILKGLQDYTFKNLAKRNSNPTEIDFTINSNFDYQILSREELTKNEEKLYRYYVFSRVGFSSNGSQAIVMFTEVCEPLCSKGAYYLLSKKNGVWEIEEKSESWRS